MSVAVPPPRNVQASVRIRRGDVVAPVVLEAVRHRAGAGAIGAVAGAAGERAVGLLALREAIGRGGRRRRGLDGRRHLGREARREVLDVDREGANLGVGEDALPGQHRRARKALGDSPVEIVVGRQRPRGRQSELEDAQREVAGSRGQGHGRGSGAATVGTVTTGARHVVELFDVGGLGRRWGRRWGLGDARDHAAQHDNRGDAHSRPAQARRHRGHGSSGRDSRRTRTSVDGCTTCARRLVEAARTGLTTGSRETTAL